MREALQASDAELAAAPGNAGVLLRRAAVLNAMHRQIDAAAVLDRALELEPANLGLRLLRARQASALGDGGTVETLYTANLAADPHHPPTLLARLETAFAVDMSASQYRALVDDAQVRLEAGLTAGRGRAEDYRQALGDLAFQKRDWQAALGWWRSIGLEDKAPNRRSLHMAQCHLFRLDELSARLCLEAVLAATPDNLAALQLLAELELSLGHWEKSLKIRRQLFAMEGLHRVPLGVRLAQDLFLRGEREPGEEVQRLCAALAGERLEIAYARLLIHQHRAAEAWDYAVEWQDCADQSPAVARLFQDLGKNLGRREGAQPSSRLRSAPEDRKPAAPKSADEVRALFREVELHPGDAVATRPNLRIAWQLHAPDGTSYEDWLEVVFRSSAGTRLLALRPLVSVQELAPLTVASDFDILRPFAERGEPVLLACSHQGLFAQHLMSLYFPKLRFLTMGETFDDDGNSDRRNLPSGGDRIGAAASLVKALRQGSTIILPVDNSSLPMASAIPVSAATGRLFGIPTRIPDTIPRLAREFGRPSFWIYSYWLDGQVRYDIQRLPDPAEGEGKEAWHDRWAEAYLARLEAVMKGRGENINVAAPLWRHLLVNGDKAVD